jgi:hypothetical protein
MIFAARLLPRDLSGGVSWDMITRGMMIERAITRVGG